MLYMIATETQASTPSVCHIGTQCELLLPPAITSTQRKATVAIPKPNISDVIDDDDDVDDEIADTTQSTLYEEATSASETESDLPLDKQKTYLIFEPALLLLFSICFMCRSIYISIEKVMIGSVLRIKQICRHCKTIYMYGRVSYM